MPTPTIPAGNLYMNATLYTGNGSTQTITNGVAGQNFQPDLVWIKQRSAATGNDLTDTVRGATKTLQSQDTAAEETRVNDLTAFTSTGFSVGSGGNVNTNAGTYVGWQWKAGGTAVSNTSGSITSSVSANTTSGFSIVTYTGTGSNATVGHGLGVAPQMVIVKKRSGTSSWPVYHIGLTSASYYALLESTSAETSNNIYWQGTTPTSSVFSIGTTSNTNENASTYVAYCWTPIAGYSAFGKYTGNGSTDGPFIYTGFRPKFVMLKRSDSTSAWTIQDSARDPENTVDKILYPNYSDAEFSGTDLMDFVSNGFKLRQAGTDRNASGGTYIYMAFAENPFKYANAR